ncbi:hypothetical protein TCAL_00054 [Tigriopus californicus]|uniref:SSD domain-containing protein n=1 Tax=Tigriopus californicus TaxID=6832 RepID=A0A553PFJ2_TIGCA|nr:hypothetical protein TCAL_00054 [Tigriopus californicus]
MRNTAGWGAALTGLLALLSIRPVTSDQCVWYGKCGRDPDFGDDRHALNCYNPGPAPSTSLSDLTLLYEVCPHFATEFAEGDVNFCCDRQQILDMQDNFNLPGAILARCPTCLANFKRNFCDLTCHPRQASFVEASKTVRAPGYQGEPVDMVKEVTYYMNPTYAEGTFESCQNVVNPATSGLALNFLCGPWGSHLCTPKRWFDYMGSINNGYSPFNIIYNFTTSTTGSYRPHNPSVTPCHESVHPGVEAACSCTDCESACSTASLNVDESQSLLEMNINHLPVAMAVIFVVGTCIFLATVFVSNVMSNSHLPKMVPSDSDFQDEDISSEDEDPRPSLLDRVGMKMELAITSWFTQWGMTCAKYPLPVMVLSVAFAIGLSTGVYWLKVETDPIELWAAPGSRSRVEKDFFDQTFRPFYRTEQVIVHAKNIAPFEYLDTFDEKKTFGPVFNQSAFLVPLLKLQKDIESIVAEDGTTFEEICNAPLSPQLSVCNIQSIWAYWQGDVNNLLKSGFNPSTQHTDTYLDHFLLCARNPANPNDGLKPPQSCMSEGGIPVQPYFVLGGFIHENETAFPVDPEYEKATAVVMTFLVDNYDGHSDDPIVQDKLKKIRSWEMAFVHFMKNWTANSENTKYMDIAFNSERSIEDELERETSGDILTIAVSYVIMFFYITFSLGQVSTWKRFLVESKVTLGIGGVLIVLLSVGASVGIFGFLGVSATLIIFEIIPFLVLAVGVDNIFILVQTCQRDPRKPTETTAEHTGRIVGEVAPSMLLSSVSESTCFFLGALSDMPAVRAFALYAGMALLIDFFMQISCFVSLIALDMARQENNRYDIICCVKADKKETKRKISMPDDSFVLKYFEYLKTFLSVGPPFYVILNSTNPNFNLADQNIQNRICGTSGCDSDSLQATIKQWSMKSDITYIASPAQSWMDDYFAWLSNPKCCSYDPDTWSVCQSNSYAKAEKASGGESGNLGSTPMPSFFSSEPSVVEKESEETDSFFDSTSFEDFFADDDFIELEPTKDDADKAPTDNLKDIFSNYDEFYYLKEEGESEQAGNRQRRALKGEHGVDKKRCAPCSTRNMKGRPSEDQFRMHLQWFLKDNPGETCPVAGQAAYRDGLRLYTLPGEDQEHPRYRVRASNFMAFHSILKNSEDYTKALKWSRKLASELSESINKGLDTKDQAEVFTYSIFYVFYEQYLTMWEDTLRSLGISLLAIFIVTFILMGLDLCSSLIVILVILMILVDLGGLMFLWGIQLNAVSLVNLVMAVGISVEFCSHMTRFFAVCIGDSLQDRAKTTLVNMGSSVLSGITLTKFGGIVVLAFAKSQIFKIFYFRMYLGIVLIGAAHGLIFLPVILSYAGPRVNLAKMISQTKPPRNKRPIWKSSPENSSFECAPLNT